MTNQHQITAGPSREELFDALRLRHEGRKVSFTATKNSQWPNPRFKVLGETETFDVSIDSIGVEDGSGNNWLLTISDKTERFEGYFNTTRREGWLKPMTK